MTPAHHAGAAAYAAVRAGGFEFVRELARALADGGIELPSYPQVALRPHKLLADEDTDAAQLMRVLGVQGVLSARITAMAGSVAHIRQADAYRPIAQAVALLWRQSAQRAAMSFVLARHTGGFRPATAMLAGMLAGVGKLHLLARASRYPALLADPARFHEIVRDWHVRVAQALLENWRIAPEIVAAVRGWHSAGDDHGSNATLADVLAAADLFVSYRDEPELLQAAIGEHRPTLRLGLKAGCARLLEDSAAELQALQAALEG